MIKKILKELRLKDDYDAETMLAMISLEKNKLNRPKDVKGKHQWNKNLKKYMNVLKR